MPPLLDSVLLEWRAGGPTLPRRNMTQRESAPPATSQRVVDVLIVENDRETLAMFVDVLLANQFAVRGAANVHEAQAALRERVPDVVLCDLHLGRPDSGWNLAESIRENPRTCHVARIAMTGRLHPTLQVVRSFDEYLRKPLNLSVLLELVPRLAAASRKAHQRAE